MAKKYFCDVCEKEICFVGYETPDIRHRDDTAFKAGIQDVCHKCTIEGERINTEKLILDHWKWIVGGVTKMEEDDNG